MRAICRSLVPSIGLALVAWAPPALHSSQGGSATLPESDLRSAQPIVCQAMDRVELSRRHIVTDGDGIVVNGACNVIVTESHIIAGGTGILVNGNGRVTIEKFFIQGGEAAVVAHATSNVGYRDSTLRGGTAKYAMAKIVDEEERRSRTCLRPTRSVWKLHSPSPAAAGIASPLPTAS